MSVFENQLRPIWPVLFHRYVVPLLDIHTNNGPVPVPYYRNGRIHDYNVGATSSTKLRLCLAIAAGLSYLHKKNVHHGNICPTNIMINDDGGVCIVDFAFNMLMGPLTYDPYVPTPATWRYKPPYVPTPATWHYKPREELLHDGSGPESPGYPPTYPQNPALSTMSVSKKHRDWKLLSWCPWVGTPQRCAIWL